MRIEELLNGAQQLRAQASMLEQRAKDMQQAQVLRSQAAQLAAQAAQLEAAWPHEQEQEGQEETAAAPPITGWPAWVQLPPVMAQ